MRSIDTGKIVSHDPLKTAIRGKILIRADFDRIYERKQCYQRTTFLKFGLTSVRARR